VLRLELRETIDAPWLSMEPVVVGDVPSGQGTPCVYVLVEDDGVPVMRIDVHDRGAGSSPFTEAIAWAGFVVIGFGGFVHLVSLGTRAASSFPMSCYFAHFYPLEDRLLVADAEYLTCIDPSGAIRWRSERLGIDGVVVTGVEGDVVRVKGEWDPPGGWRPYRIFLSTGASVPDPA